MRQLGSLMSGGQSYFSAKYLIKMLGLGQNDIRKDKIQRIFKNG